MPKHNTCWDRINYWGKLFLLLLTLFAVLPILAGWIGDLLREALSGSEAKEADPWILLFAVVAMILIIGWLVHKGRELLPVRVLDQTLSVKPRRVVIALLSPCGTLHQDKGNSWYVRNIKGNGKSISTEDIPGMIGIDNNFQWTWQQTLRAGYHHRTRLEKLVLVGSRNGSGKKQQLLLAKRYFSECFKTTDIVIYGDPQDESKEFDTRWQADFENLNDLDTLLKRILKELLDGPEGYTDHDIIIDVTGGFKMASIAAALTSLSRPDLMFQYVRTGDNAGEVLGFNVSSERFGF